MCMEVRFEDDYIEIALMCGRAKKVGNRITLDGKMYKINYYNPITKIYTMVLLEGN